MNQIHPPEEPSFAAVVGFDWGNKKHAWSLPPAGSDRRERGEIEHTPEAVESSVSMLSARFHGQPIAAALERLPYLRFIPRCRPGPGAAPPGCLRLAA